MTDSSPIALAFSGGLDTSFCVPYLRERHARPIVTITVDTGGLDEAGRRALAERAATLGAERHLSIDARRAFFDDVLRFLLFGNVRRGGLYPLSVGAERSIQAREVARAARELGCTAVAHGSTGAGNDQVRFESALRAVAPELEILAPVRDDPHSRAEEVAFLAARGLPVPAGAAAYSINRGLWGATIGGRETLTSGAPLPESAWLLTRGAFDTPRPPERHRLAFEQGVPVAWDGESLDPVALLERVETAAAGFGIGRGIHLGDTILGLKGRVAFEAPAAEVLLTAHRELEKLVLTGRQQKLKDQVAAVYGELVHEGHALEPAARDAEALLAASQRRVTGEVKVLLRTGSLFVEGVDSPRSLMAASRGRYGETTGEWSAADAAGFCRITALPGWLHARAGASQGDVMKSVFVDKIASVTRACGLKREVRVASDIPCEEGVVVAVRVLNEKSTYNLVELASGRMAQVKRGDVVAGALGHRKALFGYSGHLPEQLAPGDVVQLLNMGGVLGLCDSINPSFGRPFDGEVLGTVLTFPYLAERIGVPARAGDERLDLAAPLDARGVPVVALVGSCMNSGKTAAACALVQEMAHRRLVTDALKATGVSLRRDVLAMEDAGARRTALFSDFGIVTTTALNAPALARTLISRLADGGQTPPDVIVAELGDGLLGTYGVDAILAAPDLRAAFTAVVLAANDPVAAWGGIEILQRDYGIRPVAVTGPATDNAVGTTLIEAKTGIPAINARTDAPKLARTVLAALGLAIGEPLDAASGDPSAKPRVSVESPGPATAAAGGRG